MFTLGPPLWGGSAAPSVVNPVVMNFNSLGVVQSPGASPVAGPFVQDGVTVSNVWAYHPAMADEFLGDPLPTDAINGYVGNVSRTQGPFDIFIQLGPSLTGIGRFISFINLSLWTTATVTIEWFSASSSLGSAALSSGSGGPFNSVRRPSGSGTWSQLEAVDRIRLTAGVGMIAIDNLSINLTAGP